MVEVLTMVTGFTVKRENWYRGHGDEGSSLLRPTDGKMCCLGFYALACGLAPEEIQDVPFPSNLDEDKGPEEEGRLPDSMAWLVRSSGTVGERVENLIASVNDSRDIADEVREAQLAEMFAENGVTVHFEN